MCTCVIQPPATRNCTLAEPIRSIGGCGPAVGEGTTFIFTKRADWGAPCEASNLKLSCRTYDSRNEYAKIILLLLYYDKKVVSHILRIRGMTLNPNISANSNYHPLKKRQKSAEQVGSFDEKQTELKNFKQVYLQVKMQKSVEGGGGVKGSGIYQEGSTLNGRMNFEFERIAKKLRTEHAIK